jgi:hypothetical protein
MTSLGPSVLNSLHQCASPLSDAFFSSENLTTIQNTLRTIIKQKTGYIIGRQSDDQLSIVMRAVYVLHADHGRPLEAEIRRLNGYVLAEVTPMVGTGISQYLGYIRDASSIAPPLPRGTNVSIKGSKTSELFKGF